VELAGKLKAAGFSSVTHAPLTFGIAVLTVAHKPGHESAINKAAGMERKLGERVRKLESEKVRG
jgi:hypothetical protein